MKIGIKQGLLVVILAALIGGLVYIFLLKNTDKTLTLYGNVDIRSVNTAFRVSGRLAEMRQEEGDTVKQQAILAKLDPAPYRIALQQAQAEVAQAQAAYQYAQQSYARQLQLLKTRAVSQDAIDSALAQRDQTQANLAQAQAALAQAELNLQDTMLLAPSDGTILTRIVEPGAIITQGAPVYNLALVAPIWIRAYVDEVNLAQAIPGRKVLVYTDAFPDKPYQGQIGFVSPTAEFTPKSVETTVLRTDLVYRLRIIVPQADAHLRQGMPVTIRFTQ
ncbi:efflux RND transporter periplasmic adaptor subunit [Utexia brackfieldae]|uniref:efflux RND transporter periplasmic adaptor subunit n=1 Tax=Utexia brackfieldae TaxID=3074108 RepID=UPI00370D6260